MPYNVTATVATQLQTFAFDATGGSWRFTIAATPGGSVNTSYSATPSYAWSQVATGNYEFTVARMNFASTSVLGPIVRFTHTTATPVVAADTTAPVVTWQHPVDGATLVAANFPIGIHYTVTDATTLLGPPQLYIEGTYTDTVVWTAVGLSGGDKRLTVTATDSLGNATTSTIRVFYNFVTPVVEATPIKRVIIDNLDANGRIRYYLWATVPQALWTVYALGINSKWADASDAENEAIREGKTVETAGTLYRRNLEDLEMEQILQAKWQAYQDEILAQDVWTYDDAYWTGESWVKE